MIDSKSTIITIGEVYFVAAGLDLSVKGFEMNVAASLSGFGQQVSHITVVPDDALGEVAKMLMGIRGIQTELVKKIGASPGFSISQRKIVPNTSSGIPNIYHSSPLTEYPWANVKWDTIFRNARCFFLSTGFNSFSGINSHLFQILEKASRMDVFIIAELLSVNTLTAEHYNLEGLSNLLQFSNVVIAGVDSINQLLGSNFSPDKNGFINACNLLTTHYPNITRIFDKVSIKSKCYGRGWVNNAYIETKTIDIKKISGSEGTAASFTAGLIYILQFYEDTHALNFATAAYALNHKTSDEYNTASIDEIIKTYQSSKTVVK